MEVKVKIEIPKGSNIKYELNKQTNEIEVDRILGVHLPYNYGFIPNTIWDDGDALDVILLGDFSLHPGSVANAIPVAVVQMHDNGESDYKVVCVLTEADRPLYQQQKQIIENFLLTYKTGVEIKGFIEDQSIVRSVVFEAYQSLIKFENGEIYEKIVF